MAKEKLGTKNRLIIPNVWKHAESKEIFEKLCPVLELWRPSQVLSFSPNTFFSLSPSKTTKDRDSQKASLQTALVNKSHRSSPTALPYNYKAYSSFRWSTTSEL